MPENGNRLLRSGAENQTLDDKDAQRRHPTAERVAKVNLPEQDQILPGQRLDTFGAVQQGRMSRYRSNGAKTRRHLRVGAVVKHLTAINRRTPGTGVRQHAGKTTDARQSPPFSQAFALDNERSAQGYGQGNILTFGAICERGLDDQGSCPLEPEVCQL